ncbi:DUF3267 domain-containing protein [Prosthecobacter fluviatilis]|uniref:DUF3267 domain-containing protein n=1 Tax=Prosthecobacter fluviatilis TaxID=445931 RepID=A0ABW0KTY0_9BACT
MIIIPGFIISLLTFPGVIVHEAAHQLMCRLTNTPVLNVCYFQTGTPAGFVVHDKPSSGWRHFFIAVAPFLINSVIGCLICLPVALALAAGASLEPVDFLLGWLGVSVGMHAFPSTGDASSLWAAMKEDRTPWHLKLVGFPVVLIIYVGAGLSVVWFDAIYAWLICFALPHSFIELLV